MYGLSASLGGVIEAVSGVTFGEFLKKELFEPLDMQDTGFFVPEEKRDRFAQIYEWKEEEKVLVPFLTSHLGEYYGEDVAFGREVHVLQPLTITVISAQMMLHKGIYNGKRILGRKTVEFIAQNHLK